METVCTSVFQSPLELQAVWYPRFKESLERKHSQPHTLKEEFPKYTSSSLEKIIPLTLKKDGKSKQ